MAEREFIPIVGCELSEDDAKAAKRDLSDFLYELELEYEFEFYKTSTGVNVLGIRCEEPGELKRATIEGFIKGWKHWLFSDGFQ